MNEKYRTYDYPITMIVVYSVCLPALYFIFRQLSNVDGGLGYYTFLIIMIPVALCVTIHLPRLFKGSFKADEYSVTFHQPFSRDVIIRYLDVKDISVSVKKESVKTVRFGSRTFYVETISIVTDTASHTFSNVMDIIYSPRIEALGMGERLFEFGKFSVLKKYMELKIKAMKG